MRQSNTTFPLQEMNAENELSTRTFVSFILFAEDVADQQVF